MSPENDQTRWIGIRPVNPSENIPTTTRKLTPAVSDLQAIKDTLVMTLSMASVDCSVSYAGEMLTVPAGEIWVITNMTIKNLDSMCDMIVRARINAVTRDVKCFYSIPKNIGVTWDGMLILTAADKMYCAYYLGGATDDIRGYMHGYKIGVY